MRVPSRPTYDAVIVSSAESWECPICHAAVPHTETLEQPQLYARYYCTCGAVLILDPFTNSLTVVPFPLRRPTHPPDDD
jgi:hypothetical protein